MIEFILQYIVLACVLWIPCAAFAANWDTSLKLQTDARSLYQYFNTVLSWPVSMFALLVMFIIKPKAAAEGVRIMKSTIQTISQAAR